MELTRQRGAVALTLDRPRIVFFDLAATFLLVERYGFDFVAELYTLKTDPLLVDITDRDIAEVPAAERTPQTRIALKSVDALTFFLWASLQAECKHVNETLTLEQTAELLTPANLRGAFNAVLVALTTALSVPAPPAGKAEAARPAAKRPAKVTPKKKRASTLTTRSASRSRR